MRLALLLLVALALALLSATSDAEGWRCSHSSECPAESASCPVHEVCIADGPYSSLGKCLCLRVLP
jgi:hypothetical protein